MSDSSSTPDPEQPLTLHWMKAQPILRAYLYTVVRNDSDADDLLQRVALTATEKFAEFDRARPFTAWAMGIARNHVLDHLRKKRNDRHQFATDLIDSLAGTHANLADEYDDRRDALRLCMDKLTGRGRKLLDLRYVNGLKPAAIADRLGLTDNAVRVALHKVRLTLGECIKRRLTLRGRRHD